MDLGVQKGLLECNTSERKGEDWVEEAIRQ